MTLLASSSKLGKFRRKSFVKIIILIHLNYFNSARACLSPHETFYAPSKKCMKFGPNARVNPCADKKDQILYDGKNNEGTCDCVDDERHLVYYDGQCYQQNYQVCNSIPIETNLKCKLIFRILLQGPCSKGFWLVLINGTISCEAVPANCVADGQHIYWSPNPETVPAECHQIGKRGPCSIDQVVTRDATGAISCAVSKEPIAVKTVATKIAKTVGRNYTSVRNARLNSGANATAIVVPEVEEPQKKKDTKKAVTPELKPSSMWDQQSCAPGSYRKQSGKCPPY